MLTDSNLNCRVVDSTSETLAPVGEQVEFSKKLHTIADSNFENVKAQVLVDGKWRKCVVEGKSVVIELQEVINKLPIEISDDLVLYVNKSKKVLEKFKKAQEAGKLDSLIEAYKIFRKNGNKTPCL